MDLTLHGKSALITGASKGIGRAIAHGLAQEGVSVFLTARGQAALDATLDEITHAGGQARGLAVDVATEAGANTAVTAAHAAFGRVDILINNVGGSLGSGKFDQATAEQWRAVVDANLFSAVWCSMAAVPHMRDQGGGCIVHINSICGREYCSSAAYMAAKTAITGLTKEMAIDLAKHKIRVNGVAPGSIMFPGGTWEKRQQSDPKRIQDMLDRDLPWGRFGTPDEVAQVAVFLCSPKASWVTGATIPVDGGQGRAF